MSIKYTSEEWAAKTPRERCKIRAGNAADNIMGVLAILAFALWLLFIIHIGGTGF